MALSRLDTDVWERILASDPSACWVVLGMDNAHAGKVKVDGTGTGDLAEVLAILQDDQLQFGGFRVAAMDKRADGTSSARPKFVSFIWSGEHMGVRTRMKATNNLKSEVMKFFRGTQVTLKVYERSELTEATVEERLRAVGGSHQPDAYVFGAKADAPRVKVRRPSVRPTPSLESLQGAPSPSPPPSTATAAVRTTVAATPPPPPGATPAGAGAGAGAGASKAAADADSGSASAAAAPAPVAAPVAAPATAAPAEAASGAGDGSTGAVRRPTLRRSSTGTVDGDDVSKKKARRMKKNRHAIFGGGAEGGSTAAMDGGDGDDAPSGGAGGGGGAEVDPDSPERDEEITGPPDEKSPAAMAALQTAMEHYMFASLDKHQREAVLDEWRLTEAEDNRMLIKQGTEGNTVFVLESGGVAVHVEGSGKVFETSKQGFLFGELALLYSAPRNASVFTVGATRLWALKSKTFKRTVIRANERKIQDRVERLSEVGILKDLSPADLQRAAVVMEESEFKAGDYIITQGDMGDAFYIIVSGTVACDVNGVGEVAQLSDGNFFGEMALLNDVPRTANVIARGDVTVLSLQRRPFETLLGPLQAALDATASQRQSEIDEAKRAAGVDSAEEGKGDEEAAKSAVVTVIDSERGGDKVQYEMDGVEQLGILGEGSFGIVRMVRYEDEIYALKRLWKTEVKQARQTKHIRRERRVLQACASPFIITLRGTNQDDHSVYMMLEIVPGGELWSLVYNEKSPLTGGEGGMKDADARFYAANVVAGLKYLHERSLSYRDLKPENLLVAANGYLKICDFGFVKSIPYTDKAGEQHAQSYTMLGSPDYLPPEVILTKGHDKSVDLWSLGCVIYELLVGVTPFKEENQNKLFERACKRDLRWPEGFKEEHELAADLILKLMQVNPADRLGAGHRGHLDIMEHPWFEDFDWDALFAQTIEPPYKPDLKDPTDRSAFELYDSDEEDEEDELVEYSGGQKAFRDF